MYTLRVPIPSLLELLISAIRCTNLQHGAGFISLSTLKLETERPLFDMILILAHWR
jgi:hypothetical protein